MASAGFSGLSRKHGVKVAAGSPCSVEEVALAVGGLIGHSFVRSAARMNKAVVLFLEKVDQVKLLVERGITVNGVFEQVLPLVQPAAKITLSNVPPFISDDFLVKELSRHGKVVSPIRKVLSGCKSPLLKHVVSHRRQLYMILNHKSEELNLQFNVRVEEFVYTLFAISSHARCFGCGEEGHVVRACPSRAGSAPPEGAAVAGQPASAAQPDLAAQPAPAGQGEVPGVVEGDGAPHVSGSEGAVGESSVEAKLCQNNSDKETSSERETDERRELDEGTDRGCLERSRGSM